MDKVLSWIKPDLEMAREKALQRTSRGGLTKFAEDTQEAHAASLESARRQVFSCGTIVNKQETSNGFEGQVSQECDGLWQHELTYTEKVKIHLARAFLMNAEVMVLQRPLHHFSAHESATILQMLREHVDNRGIGMPEESLAIRRPRSVIYSAESEEQERVADMVWELSDSHDQNDQGHHEQIIEHTNNNAKPFSTVRDATSRRKSVKPLPAKAGMEQADKLAVNLQYNENALAEAERRPSAETVDSITRDDQVPNLELVFGGTSHHFTKYSAWVKSQHPSDVNVPSLDSEQSFPTVTSDELDVANKVSTLWVPEETWERIQ